MRIGLALNCRIQPCTFHRKNYFYPDMPKAYQISQYDVPLNVDGWLDLPDGTRIGIERAHLEEDTGKSTHLGGSGGRIHGSESSLIDFNRAGVPLVEIVGRPDLRSSEHARQFVSELRAILVAIGASDAKMEEGSMRVDANVSVRRPGRAVRHALRDQEPQLGALGRSGHRLRGAAGRSTCSGRGRRSARRRGTGTRATAARTRCARRRTPTTTATSSSPTSCPSCPTRSGSSAVRAALPAMPGARRLRLADATGRRRRRGRRRGGRAGPGRVRAGRGRRRWRRRASGRST